MTKQTPPISRDQPLPAEWGVEQGLEAYLAESGFTKESYDSPWTPASVMGISFGVPNPPIHRRAIMLHDLHHVATGFGTDPAGEGQISAWEFRRGLRGLGLYVGGIVFAGVILGFIITPRNALEAWRASGNGKSLFWLESHSYDELLEMTIGELRELLDVPVEGLYKGRRGLHSLAPIEFK